MNKGVQRIFSGLSGTYDLINHILTFGLDALWRRKAAKIASMDGGDRWLDVCSGTGKMAFRLSRSAGDKTMVVAADFCIPMMAEARAKSAARQIVFVAADVNELPFRDETFDLITISFATRNININRDILTQCFREFHRILKHGGRFINLETSQPSSHLVRALFHLYIRLFVKPVGSIISGSKAGYTYLSNTIPRFYNASELAEILHQAGFAEVNFHKMMFGIAAIHKAVK